MMNRSYLYLLRRRYHHRWRELRERIKYYMDFSLIYVILLVGIFIALYREAWTQPHSIIQGMAGLLLGISENFFFSLGLILLLQFAHKGLTTPPMLFDQGDTYFLFTLPIPKGQYITLQWLLVLGRYLLMVLASLTLLAPLFHLMWEDWLLGMGKIFLTTMGTILILSTTQWLTFQLPLRVKGWILRIFRWLRNASLVLMGIFMTYLLFLWIFHRDRMLTDIPAPAMDFKGYPGVPVDIHLLIWILCPVLILLSTYFIRRCSLEHLKDSSLKQARIKALMNMGLVQEARGLRKGKVGKGKRYFLSIPGYYGGSKIFLWRNASQLIKQPLTYLLPYVLYIGLSMAFIQSSQGQAISLVFIFFALYILGGQLMLIPFKKHYEENHFLQIFPRRSEEILKGYLYLPLILTIVGGSVIALFMGWVMGNGGFTILLMLNLPFYSYYTLLAAMQNVLEDISWTFSPTNTLNNETMLLMRGAAPIIFSILFSTRGVPIYILGGGTMILYALLARSAKRDATEGLKKALGKFQ